MNHRSRQRQREARVGDLGEGNTLGKIVWPRPGRDDRHRALGDRIRDEAGAIRLGAGERDEDLARRDLAAVEGDARDGARGVGHEGTRKQAAEAEGFCHDRSLAWRPTRGKRQRVPQAPSRAIRGKGETGGSKRGGRPRIGAVRSITLPVVMPAFQAAVE